jgi:hypothetical protein
LVGVVELNNGDGWVLPKMLEPNVEVVDDPNGCDEVLAPNGDVDELNGCDEELAPNGDGVEPKIDGAAADVEEPNADELKAGVEPNPVENVEVFGANGLLELGVVLEKGFADV